MITGIIGDLGEGKTMTLVYFVLKDILRDRKIFANFKLNKIPYTFIDSKKTFKDMKIPLYSSIFLTELHFWLDSRDFLKQDNQIISDMLLNTRREHKDVYYDAQFLELIDIRLRKITNLIVEPHLYDSFTMENGEIGFRKAIIKIYNRYGNCLKTIKIDDISYIFQYYDSYENLDYLKPKDYKLRDKWKPITKKELEELKR